MGGVEVGWGKKSELKWSAGKRSLGVLLFPPLYFLPFSAFEANHRLYFLANGKKKNYHNNTTNTTTIS